MAKDPNLSTTDDLNPAASAPDPLDHDGDGKKGGSKPGQRVKKGEPLPSERDLGQDPDRLVQVRITRAGDKLVHDGEGGRYDAGDEIVLPLGVARGLQATNRAEIVGSVD